MVLTLLLPARRRVSEVYRVSGKAASVRDLLPGSLDVVDLGRHAQVTLRADLVRDTRDFRRERCECREPVDHLVDGDDELEDLAMLPDGDLLAQVCPSDGRRGLGDASHLVRKVAAHDVDRVACPAQRNQREVSNLLGGAALTSDFHSPETLLTWA